jgi:hypothetical protein
LQFGEIIELEIERVDADEAEHVENVEDKPEDEHEDVVGEDHVVDDDGVKPSNDLPGRKDAHDPSQPMKDTSASLRSASKSMTLVMAMATPPSNENTEDMINRFRTVQTSTLMWN